MDDDVIFYRPRQAAALTQLVAMPYEAEKDLQELLAEHSQLLAGAQMNRADPRRFLLVRREAPVADHDGGGGRWSLDHLFLDQDAVPTLVEVKRSSDTRLRREVVGQMLDYAANGPRYWVPDELRTTFETRASRPATRRTTPSGAASAERRWRLVRAGPPRRLARGRTWCGRSRHQHPLEVQRVRPGTCYSRPEDPPRRRCPRSGRCRPVVLRTGAGGEAQPLQPGLPRSPRRRVDRRRALPGAGR